MEGVSSAEHEGICVLQSFFNMKMDRNKPMIIVCNSVENPNKDYGRIRYIVDSMVNKYIKNETKFVLKSLYYTLWETIKNGFSEEDKTNKEQNKRMQELLQYIQEHYALPLSLKGLAERYYMSDSALSREFKKRNRRKFCRISSENQASESKRGTYQYR